jgi:hypothetical protein
MVNHKPSGRSNRPIRLALRLAATACLGIGIGMATTTNASAQRISVLQGAHVATTAFRVASGATAEGTAACPAGHTVIAGGYRISGTGSGAAAVASYAPTASTWLVRFRGRNASILRNDPETVSVWAICFPRTAWGDQRVQLNRTSFGVLGVEQGSAGCPTGFRAFSHGYLLESPFPDSNSYVVTDTYPQRADRWTLRLFSNGPGNKVLTLWAFCAPTTVDLQIVSSPILYQVGNSVASATCPAGMNTIAGGYTLAEDSRVSVAASYPSRPNAWTVQVRPSLTSRPGTDIGTVYATCARTR